MIATETKTITTVTVICDHCALPVKPGCGMAVVSLGARTDESPTGQREYRGQGWPKQYHENCLVRRISDGAWGHVNEWGN